MPEDISSPPPPGDVAPEIEPSTPDTSAVGPWINPDGTFVSNWVQHLDPDLAPEASLKDFKSVKDLARSFVHTKRMVGQKGIIPPNERSTPQEIAEYRRAIGAPESDQGYQISAEGLPEGVTVSEQLASKFRSIANKHHMPQYVWQELSDAYVDMEKQRMAVGQQSVVAQLDKKYKEGVAELQRSWGRDYGINLDLVKSIVTHPDIQIDPESPGLMDPNVVKGILRLGKMISDDKFVGPGAARPGVADPEQEAIRITQDPNHKHYHAYHNGDKDIQNLVESLFAAGERRRQLARGF